MTKDSVRKYFTDLGEGEWERLSKDPYHSLEFITSWYFLEKYLPSEGNLLDAGGGPGRYTIELAKRGYQVTLLDLTPDLLNIAREKIAQEGVESRIDEIVEGSIEDLSIFDDCVFDGVLCLGGPLSHLVERVQRKNAICELGRVAKPDAPIFISVFGRMAVPVAGLTRYPEEMGIDDLYLNVVRTGDYDGSYGFAPTHYFLPDELVNDLRDGGLRTIELVGLDGLATYRQEAINKLAREFPKGWKNWKKMHYETCTHPRIIGTSDHIMAVTSKIPINP